jgi:DNA mismatch endonuclease Vsr
MPDVFTKAKRSQVISRIRGRGNKETELALMRLFRRQSIRGWRRQAPVFGKPDFVFSSLKLAVFVDGCFWHRCPKHSNLPRNNRGMKKLWIVNYEWKTKKNREILDFRFAILDLRLRIEG